MNKNEFVEKYNNIKNILNKKEIETIILKNIEANSNDGNPRGHKNLIIVMEELAELSQAVSKELRGKGDRTNLLEEYADVLLCLQYIKAIAGFTDEQIDKAITVKANRLNETIIKNGKYE